MYGINPDTLDYIRSMFEKKLEGFEYKYLVHDNEDSFYIIEDSLVLLYSENIVTKGKPIGASDFAKVHIEELTFNELGLKYNHAKLIRELEPKLKTRYLSPYFTYTKFRGFDRWYWAKDYESTPEYYDRVVPRLELRKRYDQWNGIKYNYIVLEFESQFGKQQPLVAYTTKLPYDYIRDYIKNSINKKKPHSGDNVRGDYSSVLKSFRSWKNLSVKERLEEKVTYFTIKKFFKEKEDIWRYANEILDEYRKGGYQENKRYSYQTPDHRWISELRVFQLTKEVLKDKKIIFQHRPYFLKTDYGSQLSYDIYIPSMRIAIEYQGAQHFGPVDFFGGKEAFQETQRRDLLKVELSYTNSVKLIYINYWEEITKDLIKKRINQANSLMN